MAWKRKLGVARGGVAGLRRRHRVRDAAAALPRLQGRARGGGRRGRRPHALVAQAAQPVGVLAAPRRRTSVLRLRGRHGVRAARVRRRRCAGGRRPTARSRARWRSRTASCSSATTAARSTRSARPTAARSGTTGVRRRRPRHRRRQLLLLRRGRLRPRLHREHERRRLLVLGEATARSPGATRTGGYVYASPAVGPGPGGRPTVFIGSYDGRFYALDAQLRQVALDAPPGPKISGAATLIGDLVFVSDLGTQVVVGARRRHGRDGLEDGPRRASTRRSPTGGASTSTATPRSSRSTPRASTTTGGRSGEGDRPGRARPRGRRSPA